MLFQIIYYAQVDFSTLKEQSANDHGDASYSCGKAMGFILKYDWIARSHLCCTLVVSINGSLFLAATHVYTQGHRVLRATCPISFSCDFLVSRTKGSIYSIHDQTTQINLITTLKEKLAGTDRSGINFFFPYREVRSTIEEESHTAHIHARNCSGSHIFSNVEEGNNVVAALFHVCRSRRIVTHLLRVRVGRMVSRTTALWPC
jgi:hypothetical protein